jgi:hypothetical protein
MCPVHKHLVVVCQVIFTNQKVVLGVDRLDYTKGLVHRLKAFEKLLERHPEHLEKVRYVHTLRSIPNLYDTCVARSDTLSYILIFTIHVSHVQTLFDIFLSLRHVSHTSSVLCACSAGLLSYCLSSETHFSKFKSNRRHRSVKVFKSRQC